MAGSEPTGTGDDGRFPDRETEPIPRRPPPIAREPIVPEPVDVVSEPIVSEPLVSEPILSEPIISEPIISEPIVPDPPHDPLLPDPDDEFGDPFVGGPAGGGYYGDEPPRFEQDEFTRLRGRDPGPSVYTTGRIAPLNNEPSKYVFRYVFATEKFRGEWRRHWIQLAREFSIGAIATVLMGYVTGWLTKHHYTTIRTAVLAIWAVILFWVGFKVVDWWYDRFILTNKRVMVVSGIFTRNVAMMPLLRVTDMKYVQPPLGRLLNYGNFELESAGQD